MVAILQPEGVYIALSSRHNRHHAIMAAGLMKGAVDHHDGEQHKAKIAWLGKGSGGALFGSMLTTDRAFQNFLNIYMHNLAGFIVGPLFEKPVALEKAVCEISKLMSLNPAKLYGYDKQIGTLEKGKKADIVVMDIKKKSADYKCTVKKVFVNGEEVD